MSPAATSDPLVDRFLHHLALERRLSPRTVDAYRRDLADFRQWHEEQAPLDWQRLRPVSYTHLTLPTTPHV